MALITLHNVTVGFGNAPVLENVSLSVEPGARACVTGRNGEGKSTLLKVLAGILEPDAGEVLKDVATRVAYLPQDVPEDRPGTVRDLLLSAVGDPARAHVAEALLTRLGLPPEQTFNALSGGLRRRVLLGCALAREPHLLLLDEPTNHLDVESIRWLENFLAGAPFACLFVTHDRAFLRAVARTVFDLDRGILSGWDCDYPTFLRREAELLADEAVYWERKSKKLSEEEAWLRRGVKARTCRNEGRVAALMRLRQEFAGRRAQTGSATLSLGAEGRAGDIVYRCEGVTFGYDPARPILRDVSLRILRGERVGILGANGAGKTTLLNLLLGRLTPQAGEQRLGANVKPAFFDQLRGALNPEATVAENVAEGKEYVVVGGVRKHIFGYLGDFLFTPERARTPVKALSGGERARLLLARLFLNPGNLLVMDEPTNDLDVETLELLEEELANYGGTLLLVSHDRDFIDHVATSVLSIEDGRVTATPGGYTDWQTARARQATATPKSAPIASVAKPEAPRRDNAATRLSYKEQQLLKTLPGEIDRLEGAVADLNARLSAPDADYATLSAQLAETQTALDAALERYFEVETKAEALRNGAS